MTINDEDEMRALGHFNENPFGEEEEVLVRVDPEIVVKEETKDPTPSVEELSSRSSELKD